jgi:dihydropyrimidinase
MDLLFRNATIITDGLEFRGDLAVRDGRVKAIGDLAGLEARRVVECEGLTLLPGAVDLGLNLLNGGPFDPESGAGIALATRDAARGGVTTVVATLLMEEDENAAEVIRAQGEADASRCYVDYGYHLLVGNWNEAVARQVREAQAAGVCSLWLARTTDADPLPPMALVYTVLEGAPADTLVIATPWDPAVASLAWQRLAGKAPTAEMWPPLLPDSMAAAFIAWVGAVARQSRSRVLVNGVSTAAGVAALARARESGAPVLGGVTFPHLVYTRGEASPLCWPPLRDRNDQTAVYAALEDGLVSAITSAHKPRTSGEVAEGEDGLPVVGFSTLGHFIPGLHSEGTAKWRLALTTLSMAACADPAKLAGLYPRKGSLQIGSDADIVVLDTQADRPARSAERDDTVEFIDPLGARAMAGAIRSVWLRGMEVVENSGSLKAEAMGQYLDRRLAIK